MSTTSFNLPVLNGDGSKFALQLSLPSVSITNARFSWSNTTPATGIVVAANDGRSALYTIQAAGSDLVTATLTTSAAGAVLPWQPGKLYRLGDQIVDVNGHVQQVTAASKFAPTRYTPLAGDIPQGGDGAYKSAEASRQSAGNYNDPLGVATVLNQGDGDFNGDWPAGALAGGPDSNGAGTKHVFLTGAAPVTYTAVGYSRGRNAAGKDNSPAGIDSSSTFGNDSRVQIADYSEISVGGLKQYFDAAGNLHTGWQVAKGTVDFTENVGIPPTFSTSGGTTVDGDLIWTDEGAAATTTSFATSLTAATGNFAPYGLFVQLG